MFFMIVVNSYFLDWMNYVYKRCPYLVFASSDKTQGVLDELTEKISMHSLPGEKWVGMPGDGAAFDSNQIVFFLVLDMIIMQQILIVLLQHFPQ